jgi:hypothetical protein
MRRKTSTVYTRHTNKNVAQKPEGNRVIVVSQFREVRAMISLNKKKSTQA